MFNRILDVLFPQHECCLCRSRGIYWSSSPWCKDCDSKLIEAGKKNNICRQCGKFLNHEGESCTECQTDNPPFFVARAVGPYEGNYRKIIKIYKFLERQGMAVKMGHMMADKVKETPQLWPIDMVVPVPMSSSGVRKRGFNQSELLSARIAKLLKLRHEPRVLIRVKETPPQRELSRQEREKNLKDAFAVKTPNHIQGKNVLLVDDVYTTGSTVKECTNALLKAGAARVGVISWAAGKGF